MGLSSGSSTSDMTSSAVHFAHTHDVSAYHFYPLVELLLTFKGLAPDSRDWERQCELMFQSDPRLSFPVSDISGLSVIPDDRLALETTFMGLTGSQSPLPGYLLDEMNTEEGMGRRAFLDFFNNHFINLTYRLWRKYRYYIRFEPGAKDALSAQLFALVGLGNADLRGETPLNWSKMLAYSGMLAGRNRSAQMVSGIIAHCFDLEDVDIRQWVARRVDIASEQQMQLGRVNMSLGQDSTVGTFVHECNGKFTIVLKGLSYDRFQDFLPTGKEYLPLCTLIDFVLREPMAYDLELHVTLAPEREEETRLPQLGWSTFLGHCQQPKMTIQVRA